MEKKIKKEFPSFIDAINELKKVSWSFVDIITSWLVQKAPTTKEELIELFVDNLKYWHNKNYKSTIKKWSDCGTVTTTHGGESGVDLVIVETVDDTEKCIKVFG